MMEQGTTTSRARPQKLQAVPAEFRSTVPKLFMVLPAYNEAENLPHLLDKLEASFRKLGRLEHEHAYVIVDDGSRDATPALLELYSNTLPLTVITHNPNQGLGPTIRDGLKGACELAGPDDIIFTMDADNTHPAGVLMRMTQVIEEGCDVVIASRYRYGSMVVGLSWYRKLMSVGAGLLFRIVFPIHGVRDYTCGYRAYRASILQRAFDTYGDTFVEYQGFQCMADILLKLNRINAITTEVPMILRYDQKKGQSKMNVGRTVINTLRMLWKRRLERII